MNLNKTEKNSQISNDTKYLNNSRHNFTSPNSNSYYKTTANDYAIKTDYSYNPEV